MRVYKKDLPNLSVGDACFVMEQVMSPGYPGGPLVKFYFAKVNSLPDERELAHENTNTFGTYVSGAYANVTSPVGVSDYQFTEVQDWSVHLGLYGEGVFMLPDNEDTRMLIHLALHYDQKANYYRGLADNRLSLFTEVLAALIKSLTISEPIRKLMDKILDRVKE